MMFTPRVLQPTPPPEFVKELRKIDPNLRVVWGYERYFLENWIIERKVSPERYYRMYRTLLDADSPRFIQQPIYDSDQPIYNAEGEYVGDKIVGYREFDLAPEYECVFVVEEPDHSFRPLDSRTLVTIRRTYAFERFHSISAEKIKREREQEQREKAQQSRRLDEAMDGVKDAYRELGKVVQI